MKPLSYSLIAAALACGFAAAQTTAYTTPVGYVTITIPGGNSDSTVGQPFIRSVAYQGAATSVTGSTINLPATAGLTVDQFKYAPPAQTNNYYLQVVGGALNGRYFDVVSNTADKITVDNGATDISSITNFKVIPYWTLGTLFPGGAGVGTSTDEFEQNGLVQFKDPAATGINRPPTTSYFHYTGTELQGTGWYDNDNTASGKKDDLIIDPFLAARVRNIGATKELVITGTVPVSGVATPIVGVNGTPNDTYTTVQFPLDMTLAQSGLSAVLTPSTDIFEAVDIVQVYNDTASGINKPPVAAYFYYTGTEEAGTGWYNNDNVAAGKVDNMVGILKAGRAYTVRRGASAPTGTTYPVSVPSYPTP